MIPAPLKESDFVKAFVLQILCSVLIGALAGIVSGIVGARPIFGLLIAPLIAYYFFRLFVIRCIVNKLPPVVR